MLYGGGKLAPDLTLPKLQARWAGSGGSGCIGGPVTVAGEVRAASPEAVGQADAATVRALLGVVLAGVVLLV